MIELENGLQYIDLSTVSHSSQNPIEIFKELLEKQDDNFKVGYDEIINGVFRTIRGFRIFHDGVFYGPVDVIDLKSVKEPEYLESSKTAHDTLKKLKSEGAFDFNVEIPIEYNIQGRTWRQFYDGVELGVLNLCRKKLLESALQLNKQYRKELADLGYGETEIAEQLLDDAKIVADFEARRKPYEHLVDKIPVYEERISRTLNALYHESQLMNFDYHSYNVIINDEKDTIIIIDGYWQQFQNESIFRQ